MRPDRDEVMTSIGHGETKQIAPESPLNAWWDVTIRPGPHEGWLTFAPGSVLPYHLHTFTESVRC